MYIVLRAKGVIRFYTKKTCNTFSLTAYQKGEVEKGASVSTNQETVPKDQLVVKVLLAVGYFGLWTQ